MEEEDQGELSFHSRIIGSKGVQVISTPRSSSTTSPILTLSSLSIRTSLLDRSRHPRCKTLMLSPSHFPPRTHCISTFPTGGDVKSLSLRSSASSFKNRMNSSAVHLVCKVIPIYPLAIESSPDTNSFTCFSRKGCRCGRISAKTSARQSSRQVKYSSPNSIMFADRMAHSFCIWTCAARSRMFWDNNTSGFWRRRKDESGSGWKRGGRPCLRVWRQWWETL